ncbi:MAG: hypothetical protein OHK0022_15030 [Roseiflexaceae bacterium]
MSNTISHIIVKIAELCNLNCSYCYLYQHEDQRYLTRPKFISDTVFEQLLTRLQEYRDRHGLARLHLIFHGGEPTLIGPKRLSELIGRARARLGDTIVFQMQTNATLLDSAWIELIRREQLRVGVSLDGPAEIHDAVRVDHAGRGSYHNTVRGLALLQQAGFGHSVLCVINPGMSGLASYRHFRSIGVKQMHFLLPDVSHDNKARFYGDHGPTPVADYLIPIFDAWLEEDDPSVKVNPFHELMRILLGGRATSDAFGNPLMSYLIVETDGTIHGLDVLRVCNEGIAETGLNLFEHGFDDLHLGLPLVHQLINTGMPLCAVCQQCAERDICGGGYVPHRYARANGFDNPSVWCADIQLLLTHMRSRLGLRHEQQTIPLLQSR